MLYEQAIVNTKVKQDANYPSIPQTEGVNDQQNIHHSYGGNIINDILLDDQPEVFLQMVHPVKEPKHWTKNAYS